MSTKKSTKKKSAKKKKATKKKAKAKKSAPAPKKYKALQGKSDSFWRIPEKLGDVVFAHDAKSMGIVRLDDHGGLNNPRVRISQDDVVWFRNEGNRKRKLTPDRWVFTEPQGVIVVPAGSAVGPFHLDPAQPIGHVHIAADPPHLPLPGQGPPGDPGFDTDG